MNFDIIAVRLAFDKNAYWCKNVESHADSKEKTRFRTFMVIS